MKYDDIRGILRYVPQFRGKTFVVLLDSALIEHDNLQNVLLDLAVLSSLSIRVVVVFGARQQVISLAERRGVTLTSPDATGVTDDTTLEVSVDAVSRLTMQLLQQLNGVGLRAAVSNAITAHPAGVIKGRDLGHSGTIDRVDAGMILAIIEQGIIPLVAPVGFERGGRVLRVNSAAAAVQVASAIGAAKLLFVGAGVVEDAKGQRIRQLSVEEARALSARAGDGEETEHSQDLLLRHAARACEGGVARVHFLDGRTDDALLGELFSIEGVGTMVYGDAYQKIRPARKADIEGILRMVRHAVADEELVARNRQEIRSSIEDYFVLEVDGNVTGVVALHPWPEHHTAELAFLYVRQTHEGMGYGRKLVQYAEKRARDAGYDRLFALSTQAYNFFENKLGFLPAEAGDLPPARREKLLKSGRNSRVMFKSLTG
ncbi:MAG TPA: amino-acid N-acetyltransferase [Verrucomicrobiales bacterium]|nr:amino-acid N-acetyltransferase [Verrucomicrobiales bacterium]